MPKSSVSDGSLKAAILGSIGFRGAELQHFEPIDIYGRGRSAHDCDKKERGSLEGISDSVFIAAMGMTQPVNRKPNGRGKTSVDRETTDGLSSKHVSAQSKKSEAFSRHGSTTHGKSLDLFGTAVDLCPHG